MPIVRYIVWVSTSLLVLLFVANWFLPEPIREAAQEVIDEPVIRIASAQRPPESVFIDTSQLTISPPPKPLENAIPDTQSPMQSYASAEPPPVTVGLDQKKPRNLNPNKAKVAVHKPPSVWTHVVAADSPSASVHPTRLSLLDVVSGMGRKLFNLR
jgi:hypothetical protein